MKKKQAASRLPSGEWKGTKGLNGLMDGFDMDEPFGSALDESYVHLAEKKSAMPEDFFGTDESQDFEDISFSNSRNVDIDVSNGKTDLRSMLSSQMSDLSWLTLTPDQVEDKYELAERDYALEELAEEWSHTREITSNQLVPNKGTSFAKPKSKKANIKEEILLNAKKLMGDRVPSREVASTLKNAYINYPVKTAQVLEELASEQDLLGTVYVEAETYEKCHNLLGKTANLKPMYVVAKSKCQGCVFNVNGKCATLKGSLVASVPWKKAFRQVTNTKCASSNAKVALQKVLQGSDLQNKIIAKDSKTQKASVMGSVEYKDSRTADRNIFIPSMREIELEDSLKSYEERFSNLIKLGNLPKKIAVDILTQTQDWGERIRLAAEQVSESQIHKRAYEGNSQTHVRKNVESFDRSYATLKPLDFSIRLAAMVRQGAITDKQKDKILALPLNKQKGKLTAYVNANLTKKANVTKSSLNKVAEYSGISNNTNTFDNPTLFSRTLVNDRADYTGFNQYQDPFEIDYNALNTEDIEDMSGFDDDIHKLFEENENESTWNYLPERKVVRPLDIYFDSEE